MNQRLSDVWQLEKVRTVSIVVLALIATIAALYFGAELLVPIAFAVVLNSMLRPVARWIEQFHMPATLSAALIVLALIGFFALVGYGLSWPIETWMREVPEQFEKAQSKLDTFRKPIQKLTDAATKVENAARGATTAPTAQEIDSTGTTGAGAATQPAPPPKPADARQVPPMFARVVGTTTGVITAVVEVLLILYLLLASGELFLQKTVKSISRVRDKKLAVQVVHDVEQAVRHYMLVTALINVGQAIAVGLALWAIGMPNPLLWGLFTFILEFIPYLGGTIMVALLSVIALATFESPGRILAAPGSYLLITTIQNNVVSPYVYGNRLKLNPVAVLIGVLFWWFVWGIAGAFIAVPIIAAVKILCDRTESCKPLGEFLGE